MKTKIYEYSDGNGNSKFSPFHVLDEGGRGCWELEVDIPDFLNPYETVSGEIAMEPENCFASLLSEALISNSGKPCLSLATENGSEKYYNLSVDSRTEKSTAMYL